MLTPCKTVHTQIKKYEDDDCKTDSPTAGNMVRAELYAQGTPPTKLLGLLEKLWRGEVLDSDCQQSAHHKADVVILHLTATESSAPNRCACASALEQANLLLGVLPSLGVSELHLPKAKDAQDAQEVVSDDASQNATPAMAGSKSEWGQTLVGALWKVPALQCTPREARLWQCGIDLSSDSPQTSLLKSLIPKQSYELPTPPESK